LNGPIWTFHLGDRPAKDEKAAELKTFFAWALTKGQPYGLPLYFVPIPKIVLRASQKTLARVHS
jgi:ABC-type phosphate transport system substrate-binding protein